MWFLAIRNILVIIIALQEIIEDDMSEEMDPSVAGDESQVAEYTVDASGAVVRKETADADKEFDADHSDGNDWREQR